MGVDANGAYVLNPFRRRRRDPMRTQDAATTHAEIRLEELRKKVKELENVRAVVTVRTHPQPKSP